MRFFRQYPVCVATVAFAITCSCGGGGSSSSVSVIPPASKVSAPTFSPPAGTFTTSQSVALADATTGATIYFTTDGSTPTSASTPYTTPIAVNSTKTISALAVLTSEFFTTDSSVSSATFTISTPQVATPTFSPAAATYSSAQSVTISDSTIGASIYYTTDGSTPTTSSTRYTAPITISATETVNALAVLSGDSNSIATGTFTIATPGSSITVNQANPGATVTNKILGMNMAYWFNPANSAVIPAYQSAGINTVRWPGGSGSDYYHWKTNTLCKDDYTAPNSDFADFAKTLAVAGNFDLAITANYGTNSACNGGGDPAEAAAWVTAALTLGANVTHWTVGNESFGYWEEDMHTLQHDPATYAAAVSTGYYPMIKAANPNALVGVVVDAGYDAPAWDPIVLASAPYDFVEYHFYPQDPGHESDSYLVTLAAQQLTADINTIKSELSAAGHANTPIYVGEIGSVDTNPGKQTTSITQALFAGQVLGEMMNAGISRATWWIGFGGCSDASSGNFSSSLYGWQTFGGYMVFSDGLPESGCTSAPNVPVGTLLPTARAYQLFKSVAVAGEHALSATVTGDTSDVRAYAATNNGGAVLVLFNLNQTTTQTVSVVLSSQTRSSNVSIETYDKGMYDQSKNNVSASPTMTNIGAQNLPLTLTLTPWSMNIVLLPQ